MSSRILIADDHAIFRSGLRLILEKMDGADSIHEADSLDSLCKLIASLPEQEIAIVIIDLQMPGMERQLGISEIRRRLRQVPILVLSASEDANDVFQTLAAGASGYIAKSANAEKLFKAIETVRAGGVSVPRDLLTGISNIALPSGELAKTIDRKEPSERTRVLTPRQLEVLELVATGAANKEIAFRLNMNEGTVKAHVHAIMRQLDVRNRVQIVRAAENIGLLSSVR